MAIPFILPGHKDWAEVRFEYPKNMKISDLLVYKDNGAMRVDIPLYVINSSQSDLIGNHTIWTRGMTSSPNRITSTLFNLIENCPDLPNRVFRLTRLGQKGDPKTEYTIELIN